MLAPGLLSLKIDTSTDSVLDRRSEAWSFYEHSQSIFGGDELIVVAKRYETPFSRLALAEHLELSDALENVAGVARVDSLATFPIIQVDEDGNLNLDPPLSRDQSSLDAAPARAKEALIVDRIVGNTLISQDGRTLALSVVLEARTEHQQARILADVRNVVGTTNAWVSGTPVFRVEANRQTREEVVRFAQATAGILATYLLLAFRRMRAVALGLIPGALGTVFAISAMGMLGVPISIATMILPSMLIALGCAYSMHMLVACSEMTGRNEIFERAKHLALPLVLSGLTTAIGLLSLSLVRIDAVRHVGVYGSLGVLAITFASLTLLPSALVLFPLDRKAPGRDWNFSRLVCAIELNQGKLISTSAILVVVFSFGLSRVEVETDATTWFRDGHPVRNDYLEIREHLSGISPMNVVLESKDGISVLEPNILEKIDALSDFLESQVETGKAVSIADPLRQINGGFLNDASMPLPRTRLASEQYMLLLDGVEMIGDVLSTDRTAANIVLRVDDNGSGDILSLATRAEDWWAKHGSDSVEARATGVMFEFARAEDAIAYGQIAGLSVALGAISLILLLIFRRIRLALVALLPNVMPLVLIFGLMGLIGIPIDAGTVLIGSLALGIAVDDTIHLLTTFVDGIERGYSSRQSLEQAYQRVLPAVISSTVMIAVGFGVFYLSDFSLTRNLGWLTSCVMVICLAADVFVLGWLLLNGDWRRVVDGGGT